MRLPPGWLVAHNAEATGRRLAEAGLRALGRPVQIDTAGSRQFLRSIVAEGGIPRSLLRQDTAYRRTVLAALEEFEAMRVLDHGAAVVAVSRHDGGLAQVFQSEDIRHLVADLVLKLAELRAAVPERARAAPETWLDATRPGWRDELPMRLDEAAARLLVADALAARRRPDADDKLVTRLLVRGSDGIWQSRIRLGQRTLLPLARLSPIAGPEATSARLSPDHPLAMHLKGAALRAELDRDERTWTVSLVGPGAGVAFPFALEDPATFSVLVDGWNCGRLVPAGGEGAEDGEISFWSPESLPDETEAGDPGNGPLRRIGTGSIATRSPVISMLAPARARVSATGLTLAGPEAAGSGAVYHLRGQGEVSVDGETLRVRTGADKESAHTLAAAGRTVARTTDGARNPVYLGTPAFSIHSPHGVSRPATARQLVWGNRASPARPIEAGRPPFGTGTLACRDVGETVARGRFSIVPKGFSCRLSLADRETRLVVEIDGLPAATVVSLSFGPGAPAREGTVSSGGAARLEVALGAEVPPEQLVIGLKSAEGALDLRMPFPSSSGSFVGPTASGWSAPVTSASPGSTTGAPWRRSSARAPFRLRPARSRSSSGSTRRPRSRASATWSRRCSSYRPTRASRRRSTRTAWRARRFSFTRKPTSTSGVSPATSGTIRKPTGRKPGSHPAPFRRRVPRPSPTCSDVRSRRPEQAFSRRNASRSTGRCCRSPSPRGIRLRDLAGTCLGGSTFFRRGCHGLL